MKKKEKTVCQIIRFRGKIEAFLVSIDEFAISSTYDSISAVAGRSEAGEHRDEGRGEDDLSRGQWQWRQQAAATWLTSITSCLLEK